MIMFSIDQFINGFALDFPDSAALKPWELIHQIKSILLKRIQILNHDYLIEDDVAIHKTARIDSSATIKGPAIIGINCFIGGYTTIRGGVFLSDGVSVGTSCEIKSSMVFDSSSIAHFNFIGDSLIGKHVNFEAGAVTANTWNERKIKLISVAYKASIIQTGTEKFGALVGDRSKIGANAVLSPGTLLNPASSVRRLELVNQTEGFSS